MCSGGGSRSTITMPDTGAYDRMASLQLEAMRRQQDGALSMKQQELNTAIGSQQQVLERLGAVKTQRANETAANAARLAALIGTPPPEKTAKAPVVGSDRKGMSRPKGRKGLRIDRGAAMSGQSAGAGLNITTDGG